MKYYYNYDFSEKIRKKNLLFLSLLMVLGIVISVVQMSSIFSIEIIIISILFTVIIFSLILYIPVIKNWHKARNGFYLDISDKLIKIHDIHGIQEISMDEIKKAYFRSKNNKISEIILIGKRKYKITNFFENLELVSIELRKILNNANIEIGNRKNTITFVVLTVLITLTVIFLSYYLKFTSNSMLIRSLADKFIPISGGIILLISPKQEKGFVRGNRKNILSVLLISISIFQIILEVT